MRWWRLATLGLLGIVAVGLVRWYVVGQATQGFQATAPAAGPVPAAQAPQTQAPAPRATESSAYEAEEDQLRALLPTDTREVKTDGALEDALLIELTALRLDVVKVEAPILTWTGRKKDMPQTCEVRVTLRSQPEDIDWELGGVGLVVGKYILRYGLDLTRFEVVFEGLSDKPMRRSLNPDAARQFYMERKSLMEFLKP